MRKNAIAQSTFSYLQRMSFSVLFSYLTSFNCQVRQIKMAKSTLKQIKTILQKNGTVHELRDASKKFYTLIPHAFGINRPPIIERIETVAEKRKMLENLLNMKMVYKFLGGENGEKTH